MPKLKCRGCKNRFEKETMIILNGGSFHSINCAIDYAMSKQKRDNKAKSNREEKAARKKQRADRERVKPRTEWLDKLQELVNQYVVHVRDKNKPCCTCGTLADIKYDAGHFISRGSSPELRFQLTNIHKQCSIKCNVYGSGMRAEYNKFIIDTYGEDHYNWLIGPHKSLKDQLPSYQDIKHEISVYRKLLRDAGIKPRV